MIGMTINKAIHYLEKRLNNLLSVAPVHKKGHWVLTQRDKCVDMSCSKCGNTRFKEYAYTIGKLDKKINDLIVILRLNYCECCGARMQGCRCRNEHK